MKDYKAVIFDMDGVIFDSEREVMNSWIEVAERYDIKDILIPYYNCIGSTRAKSEQIMLDYYGGDFPYKLYREEVSKLYHERNDGGKLPLKPGAKELLEYLKSQNKKIALASSTRNIIVTTQLKDADLFKYFDKIITGDMVSKSKPDPEIFLKACKEIEVKPNEAFVIEDSYNGIKAAFSAGIPGIMVPDLLPPTDEMKEKATVILNSLTEVKEWLK